MFQSEVNPMFRSKFSEDIFNAKYRHTGCETWAKLAEVLVEDVCGKTDKQPQLLTDDEMRTLKEIIRDLKFIPGGRYLYYAGRNRKFFNNCLIGETRIATRNGLRRLDSFQSGETVDVLSPITGDFLPAAIYSHGQQPVQRITFVPVRGRSKKEWLVTATRTHHWPLIDGSDTYDLRVGDVVPGIPFSTLSCPEAFVHGLIFADATLNYTTESDEFVYQFRLCGAKARWLDFILEHSNSHRREDADNGDPIVAIRSTRDLKKHPIDADPGYMSDFIRGWIVLDGHCGEVKQLHSIDEAALDWFIDNAFWAGLIVTGEKLVERQPSNFGPRAPLYRVNYQEGRDWAGFKVQAIEPAGVQEVYCPFEPLFSRIVIDYGIDTFNCYLLRAEEDSREDWANLSWKAESCLMTGGGIGIDYSIYRKSNSVLSGTGGFASGPIPKMLMINEIGRNVMQGGSRRSAIYASINWKHGDVEKFLTIKNWQDMAVPGTKLSLADLKREDFNWPAPLDMTNISVNYDTDWYLKFCQTGDPGELFQKNVLQAVSTAEPGFSFNFFEQERDTLRNACTEVVSADDSDVCNLGSINLGRIETIEEFKTIVELATKFLLCGTLRADLPYKKVYEVREKNRRLGLGLMGIHEWLLKRGHRYEVVPELHDWLRFYRGVTNKVSNEFADKLSVSRPIARRAIAPTGTIGILAGTSTGIEPIFAVAYKRRYLREGTKWHYQYVVDSAAQELIKIYGLDPDKVESALDLADDYERRMKVQADVQEYVDQAISSTINLPKWGSKHNNPDTVRQFTSTLAKYAPRLRGFTCYPDGARGGQPLTPVSYAEAVENLGKEFEESIETHDICSLTGHGGVCGV